MKKDRFKKYRQKTPFSEIIRLQNENEMLRGRIFNGFTLAEGMTLAAYMLSHDLNEIEIKDEAFQKVMRIRPVLERYTSHFRMSNFFRIVDHQNAS